MSSSEEARTIAVIGAGVSGLTAAYEMIERSARSASPVRILCLEGSSRSGGYLRSERVDGFLHEWGPNGFLDSAKTTLVLARRLGIESELLPSRDDARVRYIFRGGALRRVPGGAAEFLRSDILGATAKLRLLLEPLIPKRSSDDDESVFDFAARRIGRGAASILVDAMVSGIHAGDSRALSLRATFPRMQEMEQKHGTLFRAMLARQREARKQADNGDARPAGGPGGPAGTLTSFRFGMQTLTDALARELGDRLVLDHPVRAVSDLGLRGFRIHPEHGAPFDVDAVVMATPAPVTAEILESTDPELASVLAEIRPAPVAVLHFGYREDAMGDRPKGFGFLVPRGQGARILGALFSSDIYDGRAPEGSTLITVMIGGAHDPEALQLSDEELVTASRRDLEHCMGVRARPYTQTIVRHTRGIPQYTLGHSERLAAIERRLVGHPGLWLYGNSYRGVAVNSCIAEAPALAEAALDFTAGRRTEQAIF